jgi:Zn-dependent protease
METRRAETRAGVKPSPLFLAVVALTAVAAWLVTTDLVDKRVAAFVFVMGAWTLSLIFHEFAHAFVAWRSGDYSVEQRGYLTLDPRNYTHPVLSVVFPVIIVMIGGLPLPGGAVYLNRAALSEGQATLVSLAGPLTNLAAGLVAFVTLSTGLVDRTAQPELAQAVALFAVFQIVVFILNMLPIPGLDGYGVIEPALPPSFRQLMKPVANFTFIILLILFLRVPGFSGLLFDGGRMVAGWFGVEQDLWVDGYDLIRFWQSMF